MLAKQYCLQKNKDFESVFKNGRIFSDEFLFLKVKKNNLQDSRFGFIIGKKISKKAVVRNKIKRRLREIIRKKLASIESGFDVVIGAKEKIINKDYWEIEKEIGKLLKKAGLYE